MKPWTRIAAGMIAGAVFILLLGAAADINRHFPGGITLSGNAHLYTDSGAQLLRDGAPVGGAPTENYITNTIGNVLSPASTPTFTGVIVSGTISAAELDITTLAIGGQTPERLAWWHVSGGTTNLESVTSTGLVAGDGSAITVGSGLDLTGGTLTSTASATTTNAIGITIDGGGAVITTGVKGYIAIPYACTLYDWTMLADVTGSAVVDVWRCTYADFDAGATHPVAGDKLTASAPPTITTNVKGQSLALSTWLTNIVAGDVLAYEVTSCTAATRLTLSMKVVK